MKTIPLFLLNFILLYSLAAQDMQRVRKYIDTLAAPGMHGRGYFENGDRKAAQYIEDRYKEIGILPFEESSAHHPYFQHFKFDINTFPNTFYLRKNKDTLKPGEDFIAHPASGPGKGKLKVVGIDTCLLSNLKYQNKFLKRNTSNKALLIPSTFSKKINSLPSGIKKKIFEYPAIIEYNEKLTASLARFQFPNAYFQIKSGMGNKNIVSIDYSIDAELKQNYESQNVLGFIKGKTKPDSFIVISAHYDHLGRMGKDVYFPGANDNASGISMMLELARYYSENQPEYSIAFMAFGAEEAGLIGSDHYVKNPLFPLANIKFLINLDLMGTGDEGITVVNATKFPEQLDMLIKINEEEKLLPAINKRGPAANSDHYYFTEKGVPAFFMYTLGGIKAYHDIYDRAETLPLSKFTEVFQLLKKFIDKL